MRSLNFVSFLNSRNTTPRRCSLGEETAQHWEWSTAFNILLPEKRKEKIHLTSIGKPKLSPVKSHRASHNRTRPSAVHRHPPQVDPGTPVIAQATDHCSPLLADSPLSQPRLCSPQIADERLILVTQRLSITSPLKSISEVKPNQRIVFGNNPVVASMDVAPFQPVDRISNLPDNVMDNILMRLRLCDAAKTSILAKQWRHKWHHLPQLIFDYTLCKGLGWNKESARIKFVHILYKVLLRHQGPITKFNLIAPEFIGCSEIDDWIFILSKSNVEELTLTWAEKYKLPSEVFKCFQLKILELFSCVINCPPGFKGFNKLIRLQLNDVTIEAGELVNLISSCPLLEQLVLNIGNQADHLEIDAPMLKLFHLTCDQTSIYIKKSPLLARVSVVGTEILNFVEFFCSLPALQELHMDNCFVKYLNEDEIQSKITTSFKNLKTLELSYIRVDCSDEFSAVLRLIRSCFNLEKLKIQIELGYNGAEDVKAFLEEQDYSNFLFHHLREVIVECFGSTLAEMALVKLLLEKSPMMKRMVIHTDYPDYVDTFLWTLKELNKFGRASPNVEVICRD